MANQSSKVKDAVCGMEIGKGDLKAEYEGKTYYFCSHSCQEKFTKRPENFVSKQAA